MNVTTPVLADNGCDRATAYHMSNKVARHADGTFVTWLDRRYRVILARIDPATGEVLGTQALAQGMDNHCGATLAQTSDGALHVMAGNHACGGFIHLHSTTPADPSSWSLPQSVGRCPTYPSLVACRDDTLLLSHRCTNYGSPWEAGLVRRPAGGDWQWPMAIIKAPATGYSFTTNNLFLDPDGNVHYVGEFYKTYPKEADAAHSMGVTHLWSDDTGITWHHDDGRAVAVLPAGMEDACLISHAPAGNLRPANGVALSGDSVYCGIWDSSAARADLWERCAPGRWRPHPLDTTVAAAGTTLKVTSQVRLARDVDGTVLAVTTVSSEAVWGSSESQLLCAWFDPKAGAFIRHCLVPQPTPGRANWLAAVEMGDGTSPSHRPLILFTDGTRGKGCINAAACTARLLIL